MLYLLLASASQLTPENMQAAKPAMIYCLKENTDNDALRAEFDKAASNATNYYILNCSEHEELCSELQVSQLPVILFLKRELIYQYSGEPTAASMLEFSNVLSQPMLIESQSLDAFAETLRHYGVKVGIFVTGDDPEKFEASLAFLHGRIPVGYKKSQEVSITAIEGSKTFQLESSDLAQITNFARIHEYPLFQKVLPDENNLENFLEERNRVLALFCMNLDAKDHKRLGKSIREWLYNEADEKSDIISYFRIGYANESEIPGICHLAESSPGLLVVDQRAAPVLLFKHHVESSEGAEVFLQRVMNGEEKGEKLAVDAPSQPPNEVEQNYTAAAKYGSLILVLTLGYKVCQWGRKCKTEAQHRGNAEAEEAEVEATDEKPADEAEAEKTANPAEKPEISCPGSSETSKEECESLD